MYEDLVQFKISKNFIKTFCMVFWDQNSSIPETPKLYTT